MIIIIVRLTEVYYECKKSKLEAFFGAVGISSGTALSTKVVAVVVLTILFSRRKTGNKATGMYRTYGIDEREEVLFLHAIRSISLYEYCVVSLHVLKNFRLFILWHSSCWRQEINGM